MSNPYKLNLNLIPISHIPNSEFFIKSSEITRGSTHDETRKKPFNSDNSLTTCLINSERNTMNSKTSLNFHKNSVITNLNFINDKKFYHIKKEFFEKAVPSNKLSRNKNIIENKFSYSKGSTESAKTLNYNSNLNTKKTLPFIAEDSKSQKKNFLNTESLSISSNKGLTKKKIESEKKILKEFFRSKFPDGLDFEKETFKESKYITKIDGNLAKRQKYSTDRENLIKTKRIKNDETKKFLKMFDNPALGSDYLKSSYGKDIFKLRTHFGEKNQNRFKRLYTTRLAGNSLIAKRIGKETDIRKYDNIIDSKYTQVSKLKLKWRTIKWILENKAEVVDKLLDLNLNFLNASNNSTITSAGKGLSRQEFSRVLIGNKITTDLDLINKIFWVFDEDGDNELTYQEIAFGIEMFKNSPVEQKLKALFELCDVDNSGTISKTEFFNLLRKNIINNDEKSSMKQVVDKIFSCVKLNKNGEITFEKLKEGCEKNQEIHTIIYKNLLALKSIDTVIDKDIKSDLMKFNPELNIQLRMKLLSMTISFFPLREEKFSRFLDDYVTNKQKRIESEFLKGIREDNDSDDLDDE